MKTKLLFILFAAAFALTSWANGTEIDGIYYVLDDDTKTASVTYTGSSYYSYYTGNIVIPSTVTYSSNTYSVTSIGWSAFYGCTGLTSITIPNSVTSIGEKAFSYCSGLTSITLDSDAIVSQNDSYSSNLSSIFGSQVTEYILGNNVTGIGSSAFYGCKGLTSVTIPESVTSIGGSAFSGCTGLTSITIPNSVTSIGEYAFSGCTGLTSINIPDFVTSIGEGAFYGCSSLTITSVTIPNSVTNIGDRVFYKCTNLKSVTLNSDAVVSKNYTEFSNFKSIFGDQVTKYVIGDNITGIGNYAFYGCSGLPSINIPNSVKRIGGHAFQNCSSLTSITIPNSVTSIGGYAFYKCMSLTSVTIGNSVTSIGEYAFYGCSGLTSITIPNSVTSIGNFAFSDCTGLTSINLPSSVKRIGGHAFQNCSSLTSINIPNSVTSIGEYAFSDCSGLTSINIPNSVTSIGDYAFAYCTILTSINIPSSVTSIGERAFWNCSSLTTLFLDCPTIGYWFYDSSSIKTITLGENVTSIEENAFRNCTGLTSITIPSSVTSIGKYAFYKCTNLKSVTLNSDAVVSKNYTDSSNFKSIFGDQVTKYVLGDNVAGIGNYAFYGCTNLAGLTLSESLTEIGNGSFDGCFQAKLCVQKGGHVILLLWEKGYDGYNVATMKLITKPTLSIVNTTQSTATFSLANIDDAYDYKIDESVIDNTNEIKLTGLKAQNVGTANLYAYCRTNDKWYEIGNCQYTTANISPTAEITATGSSITLVPSYIQGDATVTLQTLKFNGNTQDVEAGKAYFFNGLSPNKYYSITYTISADGYSYTYSTDVRCASLVMNTQHPKVINTGNVIVAAITNIDDTETNVGFEWRRTDWTDDFNSNTGTAYLYEGTMEGYIRNLNTGKLWKYRPFYESADGTRHYGEWVGIDPTDTSYFDPTVHTYASIDVQGNTASVRGYVMRGTDNVTEQGFKYWKASDNVRNYDGEVLKAVTIPIDAQTITASGQVMTAKLSGLDYETDYYCVAFVTTSEGTVFYGEQQAFRTGEAPTGIDDVAGTEDSEDRTIEGYYNLQGLRMAEPQRGVNIIRYSDGTAKKVLLK